MLKNKMLRLALMAVAGAAPLILPAIGDAQDRSSKPAPANFTVRLPDAKAEVWFADHRTEQQGSLRQFVSGELDPKAMYTFHVRARWEDNGRSVEQTYNVDARAGEQVTIDFRTPTREDSRSFYPGQVLDTSVQGQAYAPIQNSSPRNGSYRRGER